MKFFTWRDDWWEMARATPSLSLCNNLPFVCSCLYALVVVRTESSLREAALFR